MIIGWPADLTWYKLLTDWGSIIGGVFALLAGAALYVIGRMQVRATRDAAVQQVAAVNRQNEYLKRSEDRRRASMVVTAARILEGILKIVDDAVSARRFGGNLDADIGVSATNQIRQSIGLPPRYELIDQPRYLGRDVIENYFLLYVKIEAFRKPGASATAASLQKELEALQAAVGHLREEIAEESRESLAVLARQD